MPRLTREDFEIPTEQVAKRLLGCVLVHVDGDVRRAGRIVETEAYVGGHDLACHASKGRTGRTEVMFGPGGYSYVYLIYGMYHCFNVVTEPQGVGAAVLVRALEPLEHCVGSTSGPGRLCRALGLNRTHNGMDLIAGALFIEPSEPLAAPDVEHGPRVGVDYAGAWAQKPLRFWVKGSASVSRTPRRGSR